MRPAAILRGECSVDGPAADRERCFNDGGADPAAAVIVSKRDDDVPGDGHALLAGEGTDAKPLISTFAARTSIL